jgi:hypothetical protein
VTASNRLSGGVRTEGRADIAARTLRTDGCGRINNFSRHPIRYRFWTMVPKINPYHGNFAGASLIWVGIADGYVRLVASGTIHDPRFF